ncbi:putative prophage phiRv2 integrase [Sphaerisporangium siamense]|uniref:Integrase n=1 Tax=Sphaerisporangium siamense TaxID=795645 RepID=A0A7W7G908_9ACTN|nr:site-specific integrase [Sphaerisporangium siamense]MBB4702323.1 integrase [Sphaerisporangium siamense]GII89480.1 putative prophage phiRv2 integrase [Sphaerisporangium siamense]
MANREGRRRFGSIRKLPSGRFQIRYPGPDGRMRTGDATYATERDADKALALVEAKLVTGDWTDPQRAKVKLGEYAEKWIKERANLRPRTVEIYRGLLRRYLIPYLGNVALGKIETAVIREWRATLVGKGVGASEVAKSYRFLRAVLMTAADDRIIPRNPCRIKGAGEEKPEERPVLTVAQVFQLADLMPERLRALVLLATFASLRWGEVAALRRMDLNLTAGTVSVRQQHVELDTGELIVGPPKSRAGVRTVAIPSAIIPALDDHLAKYTSPGDDALIFTGSRGGIFRRSNFRRAANWADATRKIGLPGLHFHDLRHTGNTLAAGSGASLRDLMERMGHDSVRAAMIYQHSTAEADRKIADAMDSKITNVFTVKARGH